MTVAELIAVLRELPQDLPVFAAAQSDEEAWPVSHASQQTISITHHEKLFGHPYWLHTEKELEVVYLSVSD